jgi:hypothetical protein
MLATYDATSAGAIQLWAADVMRTERAALEMGAPWKPNDDYWGTYNRVSKIFDPVGNALRRTWWEPELTAVGTAMRAATWHAGQHDELDPDRLRRWLKAPPPGVRLTKKRDPAPRWRGWAIVRVAECIHKHGATLRQLLKLDVDMHNVPTAAAIIAEQSSTIADL